MQLWTLIHNNIAVLFSNVSFKTVPREQIFSLELLKTEGDTQRGPLVCFSKKQNMVMNALLKQS